MVLLIDGRLLSNREAVHDYFQTQLEFPPYYGRNLDALYDQLTERAMPLEIRIAHPEAIEAQLGRYGAALLKTLYDAAQNTIHLHCQVPF